MVAHRMAFFEVEGAWVVLPPQLLQTALEHIPHFFGVLLIMSLLFAGMIFCLGRRNRRTLEKIAYVDALTGLPRQLRFEKAVVELVRAGGIGAYTLASLDLDNFKYINDSFGYEQGDQLLQAVAEHLREEKSLYCALARGQADNFLILIKTEDKEIFTRRFEENGVESRHLHALLPNNYSMVYSVGLFVIFDTQSTFASWLDRANIARKVIKGNHVSTVMEYTAEMDRKVHWKKSVVTSMERALAEHEFQVYLQPKYSLESEQMVGAEALVRWVDPENGLLAPDLFIPIFEDNGFIQKLDYYMFDRVCALIHDWQERGLLVLPISVNLSRLHIHNKNLVEELMEITRLHQVAPKFIETELTESIVFQDAQALIDTMGELRMAGFDISIDDFGSGYSSLNLLTDLPANILKIDKGFLDRVTDAKKTRLVVSKVIEMAKSLRLRIVAEGVETQEQVELLREMGCDIAQGYFYARPMPVKEFEELLVEEKEKRSAAVSC